MKELQATIINLVRGLVSELDRQAIKYFLDGGPLIGAVRHMSIIPFDKVPILVF